MAVAQRIIFLFFCVTVSFGQRIPQSFFDEVVVTAEQETRIQILNTITEKSEATLKELAVLYAATGAYEQSFILFEELTEAYPNTFEYQYLLGGISGILASELPRMKSLSYVRTMKSAFETAAELNPNALEVQMVLLELYTELPWVLGGSYKKSEERLALIKSLGEIEGLLAEGYFYRATNKNKKALLAYLNAINEISDCETETIRLNNSCYILAVLAYYLQKDVTKASCLFNRFIIQHSNGDAFPKSFARHYLQKMIRPNQVDVNMEQALQSHDELTIWIQNNFK